MGRKFKDENVDQLLRKLVNDTGLDNAKIDEIAESPQLWWGIQRKIRAGAEPSSPFNAGVLRPRWLIFGVPLTVAALLLVALFAWRPEQNVVDQALIPTARPSSQTAETGSPAKPPEFTSVDGSVGSANEIARQPSFAGKNTLVTRTRAIPQPLRKMTSAVARPRPTEVKSEFIALSYARNPESGQVVRVKVPSSMMVSLGLVASVEKPNSLVNAELLVGDDGMTHAIRFIR